MSRPANDLTHRYAAALQHYLLRPDEEALHQAYELGRQAIGAGWGVMDLAQAHDLALQQLWHSKPALPDPLELQRRTGAFLTECLWPFEMVQRGFRKTNQQLRDLNATLRQRAQELAQANAELTREIAERQRVETALRLSQEHLRQLSNQVLCAQEQERKRISRELHDEVGQALTAINMNLALVRRATPDRTLAGKVADLQHQLAQTMETIHSFTRELRPAMLDHLGLIPALRAYVRNFAKRTGLRIYFRAHPAAEFLGMEEKTVLYRVTQEGLNNVAKHAQATRSAVLIRRQPGCIQMEVRDNGQAFAVEETLRSSGKQRLGLMGIQERVLLVQGRFGLRSQPGRGTTITVEIPLKISGAKPN